MSEQFSQDGEVDSDLADPHHTDLDVERDVDLDIEVDGDLVEGSDVPSTETDTETGDEAEPEPHPGPAGAPETGDLVIDAALRDLAQAPVDDLDAQIERGEQVQRTLQGRLSDLGG